MISNTNTNTNVNVNVNVNASDENYFIKRNVSVKEYEMYKQVSDLDIVNIPKIIAYDNERKVLVMEKINNISISDFYGDKIKNISDELFNKIREIIKTLWNNNIVYPDITGYNFIEFDNKIWIIDFEHSNFKHLLTDKFVERIVNDSNYKKWNPRFK